MMLKLKWALLRAGIVKGDVIISLDNIKIEKFSDLSGYLSTKRPGDIISVGLIRDTAKLNLNVVLEKNTNISFLGMQLKRHVNRRIEKLIYHMALRFQIIEIALCIEWVLEKVIF